LFSEIAISHIDRFYKVPPRILDPVVVGAWFGLVLKIIIEEQGSVLRV